MNDDEIDEEIEDELIEEGVFKLLLFIEVPFLYGDLSKEVVLWLAVALFPAANWSTDENDGLNDADAPEPIPATGGFEAIEYLLVYPDESKVPPRFGFSLSYLFNHVIIYALLSRFF